MYKFQLVEEERNKRSYFYIEKWHEKLGEWELVSPMYLSAIEAEKRYKEIISAPRRKILHQSE